MGVSFEIAQPNVNERSDRYENPRDYVLRVAKEKAMGGLSISGCNKPVLGADTIVRLDRKIFGKSENFQEAQSMLKQLSGRKHSVFSAVAIANGRTIEHRVVVIEVTFRDLDCDERMDCCRCGEPCGIAGGYAIQGLGAIFVKHLNGSYSGFCWIADLSKLRIIEDL